MKKLFAVFVCILLVFTATASAYSGSSEAVQLEEKTVDDQEVGQTVDETKGLLEKVSDIVEDVLTSFFG